MYSTQGLLKGDLCMGTKNTLLGGALSQRILQEARRIVLVGIGGIGMSCLA